LTVLTSHPHSNDVTDFKDS